MTVNIERRLAKLEAAIMPLPRKKVRMLAEPQADAADEEREQYARDLAQAEAECDVVIVLAALKSLWTYTEGKVTYTDDEAKAAILAAVHLPSKRGNASLLHDALQDAAKNGRVLQAVKIP
jgi:hypothetical protein